jgi:cytochrome c oxidase subunit II
MSKFLHLLAASLSLSAVACGGNTFQSALHPASEEARGIAWIWWLMFGIYGAVFLATLGLGAAAVLGKRQRGSGPPGGSVRFVVIAGMIIPTVILVAMLILSLRVSSRLRVPETEFAIEITGFRWWWDVRYPAQEIVSANEIRIPVGSAVLLELKSADVIHSFWVPNLHGKMDMIPDHMNRFWLQADRPGTFRGVCAEFCGDQHALMAIDVIAMPREEFDAWVKRRTIATISHAGSRGSDLFFSTGCAACHSIQGTAAVANLGPDLTNLAERKTLASSTLPNTSDNLARWITHPHLLKPGNLMPPTEIEDRDLEALVEFLQTLR